MSCVVALIRLFRDSLNHEKTEVGQVIFCYVSCIMSHVSCVMCLCHVPNVCVVVVLVNDLCVMSCDVM